MSTSLRLKNGDLAVGVGRAFETVSGREKLLQDLTLTILERIGTDPATPTFGSTLDGGIINGRRVPSMVGQFTSAENLHQIQVRIQDAILRLQQYQLQVLRQESIQYDGQNTFEADELIVSLDSVKVRTMGTTVVAQVTLITAARNSIRLTIPISDNGIG